MFLRLQFSWFDIFWARKFVYAVANPNNEIVRNITRFCKLSHGSFTSKICSVSCFTILLLNRLPPATEHLVGSNRQSKWTHDRKSNRSVYFSTWKVHALNIIAEIAGNYGRRLWATRDSNPYCTFAQDAKVHRLHLQSEYSITFRIFCLKLSA